MTCLYKKFIWACGRYLFVFLCCCSFRVYGDQLRGPGARRYHRDPQERLPHAVRRRARLRQLYRQ